MELVIHRDKLESSTERERRRRRRKERETTRKGGVEEKEREMFGNKENPENVVWEC